jgi:carbamate kinase
MARHELHEVPLDSCDADTQGAIGYMIQQSLANEFRRRGMNRLAVTIVTQVVVAVDSPAFTHPSKPVGSFMEEAIARERAARNGWTIADTPGHGWRRVVPSPDPVDIVELDAIRHLVDDGYVVTAVGGGGIPVVRDPAGDLRGVEAVIDKDLASSLLARRLGADLFVISTDVRKVCLNFEKPNERALDSMTIGEAKRYLADGCFGAGTMAPKIQAVIDFLEAGGRRAIITCPPDLEDAIAGTAGTIIAAP